MMVFRFSGSVAVLLALSGCDAGRVENRARFSDVFETTSASRPLRTTTVRLPPKADGRTGVTDDQTKLHIEFEFANPDSLDGNDVIQRVNPSGIEDYVIFEKMPAREVIDYGVDVSAVAGIRLVGNVLEFLNSDGIPALRVAPPYVVDAEHRRHAASLSVRGCNYAANANAPWTHVVAPTGASVCEVSVAWSGVTYPAIVDPAWGTTSTMAIARGRHTATALSSGKVLFVGGGTDIAEIFDPVSRTFIATGNLMHARTGHTASLLASGKVLIAGGGNPAAELYDPATGTFTLSGNMIAARSDHTAAVLTSGKVLVAGTTLAAEIFDPDKGEFAATGSIQTTPYTFNTEDLTAVTLASGEVLIVGADQIFDPVKGTFKLTGSDETGRNGAVATLLPSGKVLITGGGETFHASEATTRLFDPVTKAAPVGPPMQAVRAHHSATEMGNGLVLIAGGIVYGSGQAPVATAELFDEASNVSKLTAAMTTARSDHTATLLPSGVVLIAGGVDIAGKPLASAEIFGDAAGDACTTAGRCASGFCVDAVCCESACTGPCEACNAHGKCEPVQGAPRTNHAACPAGDAANPCAATQCDGVDGASCRTFAGPDVSCGNASCANGTVTGGGACDRAGACKSLEPVACGAYACDVSSCRFMCSSSADCAAGAKCEPETAKCRYSVTCDGDHTTTGTNGQPLDCAPYGCSANDGACLTKCATVNDCAAPAVCTAEGKCAPATVNSDAGGCAVAEPEAPAGYGSALVILGIVVCASRRRRTAEH